MVLSPVWFVKNVSGLPVNVDVIIARLNNQV